MQIRRVILKDVCNFKDFTQSFEDEWTGRVPDSLLLIGPNGSGKTTILNVIVSLWQKLCEFLTFQAEQDSSDSLLAENTFFSFAAIEVIGLESEPIWICTEFEPISVSVRGVELERQNPGSHRIRVTYKWSGAHQGKTVEKRFWYTGPDEAVPTLVGDIQNGPEWVRNFADRLRKNLLGAVENLPNLVFLESETRLLFPVKEAFSVQPEPKEFRWLARYEPTSSRKSSLQNYLYTLKVVDEQTFENIVAQVNRFLAPKQLSGFDQRTGSLLVKTSSGSVHPIEDLSSGEKQVLLMIATLTRWLQPGGVVLIDEPDLHLHVSLATALVSHLQGMVADKGGQLILASHAPELWRMFTDSHLVRLGAGAEKVS